MRTKSFYFLRRAVLLLLFIGFAQSLYAQIVWGVTGSATPNGWAGPDIILNPTNTENVYEVVTNLTDGYIKFRGSNDWALGDYGDYEGDGILDAPPYAFDIQVSTGYYKITANFNTLLYSIVEVVFVPDTNFEQALIDLGIDSDGVVNQTVLKSDVESLTSLNVSDKGIADMTGIEAFIGLTDLRVHRNQLTEINLSTLANLELITVYQNQLTALDLTASSVFRELYADDNLIETINFANPNSVESINLRNNPISSFDATKFPSLKQLDLAFSNVSSFDFSQNLLLEGLYLNGVGLSSIDLSKNTNLFGLDLSDNPILELNLTQNSNLHYLTVNGLPISEIDLTQNSVLKRLYARNTNFQNINLSQNQELQLLWIENEVIESLDLSNNFALAYVILQNSTLLKHLDLRSGNNTSIVYFAMGNTANLTCINADANISQAMINSGKYFSEDCGDFVYIQDSNFEQALIDLGIDSDGVVNTSVLREDVYNVGWLDVSNSNNGYGITNLTGIEAFVGLTGINCNKNQISNLDFSSNLELRDVYANECEIQTINVSNNSKLVNLHLYANQIEELDVSNNLLLKELIIQSNKVTELDLSANTSLTMAYCAWNQLTKLNIANGNNINFAPPSWSNLSFGAEGNPNLECITVDDALVGNIHAHWQKDIATIYSSDCNTKPEYVYVPDSNFEQALIDLGIDSDGVVNTWLRRNDAESLTGELKLDFKEISDLTGLEAFTNITSFRAGVNQLTELDLSFNKELTRVLLSYNQIESIDVTGLTKLETLILPDNKLTELDVSSLENLKNLIVFNNELLNLDVSQNLSLEQLVAAKNNLSSIDISNNVNLSRAIINNNEITGLDLTSNTALTTLNCSNNNILQLDVSANQSLSTLYASYNPGLRLITVPISGSPSLLKLDLSNTELANFNPTLYPNLESLLVNENNLTKLNMGNVPNIKMLSAHHNMIDNIDLSSNEQLTHLYFNNNVLESLNVKNGNNTVLTTVDVSNNLLTCITADSDDSSQAPYNTWIMDTGVILSLDCRSEPGVVPIPDVNFELALLNLGLDSNGENGNILLSDAEAVLNLDVSNSSISDLTGIEAFVNIIELNVSGNQLTGLDVRGLKDLTILNSTGNPDLFCIGVDDQNNIPAGWSKDAGASYSESLDCTVPIIVAKDVTIYLNDKGEASVNPTDFDNGSSDNETSSENLVFEINQADFDCSHLGLNNNLELTVTDEAGNISYQAVNLYIEDNLVPEVSLVNNFSYDLADLVDTNIFLLQPEDLIRSASDNCSGISYALSQNEFSLPGTYYVSITATDASGNEFSEVVEIMIEDSDASAELRFRQGLILTVYPVPFSNEINIVFSKPTNLANVNTLLFNGAQNTGIVFNEVNGSLVANTSGLLSSAYTLQVTISGQTKSVIIVK